jgi:alpha-glucosidase
MMPAAGFTWPCGNPSTSARTAYSGTKCTGEAPSLMTNRISLPIVAHALLSLMASVLFGLNAVQAQDISSPSHAPGFNNPVADPRAVVIFRNARFTVLTPQMIRMEWVKSGSFEDHASLVFLNRRLPVPIYTHSVSRDQNGLERLEIKTSALTLVYAPQAPDAGKFSESNLHITLEVAGSQQIWHPGRQDTGNLGGTAASLDRVHGDKLLEPMEPGLISRDGWVLVDDSMRPLLDSADFQFNANSDRWPWVIPRPSGERQDWYFFGYGHNYKEALGDFVKVAGRIPLPPKYAFGVWWSRYWAYTDDELLQLVHSFSENNVPLDVLVVDMDWHETFDQYRWSPKKDASGQGLGWSGYSWNTTLFPYPKEFMDQVHRAGLHVSLNLHPASGVQPWETQYPAMARAMGIDPATKQYVPFDITDKKFATNYMNILHHPLEKQGVDFWWLDWHQGKTTKMPELNPTWWLNYVHFTDQEREGKRPLLFHRWGGLGNHRYEIGFSGDMASEWDSLAYQPLFTAMAANVGYAYWSHDIGGHISNVNTPELYTRWVQFGAFSPILRTHMMKTASADRRIWAYPEPYSSFLRSAVEMRYRLIPYIYTEARKTYDTGVSFLRPLYYDWPEQQEAYTAKNEYSFGNSMIVAPVTSPVDPATSLASETIWLPSGEWIEVPTGTHLTGPIKLQRRFSLEEIPVYVRPGTILPMASKANRVQEISNKPLIMNVYPLHDKQAASYDMYEDAGDSRAYQQGEYAHTLLTAALQGGDFTVQIHPPTGHYPDMPQQRAYKICLPGDWPPQHVTVNGKDVHYSPDENAPGWHYDGATLTTAITLPREPISQLLTIHVHRSAAAMGRHKELDGFAGSIDRLRQAYDLLNTNYPLTWSSDELIRALQTADRITYHPETSQAELAAFPAALEQAYASIQRMAAAMLDDEHSQLEKKYSQDELKAQIAAYSNATQNASSILQDIVTLHREQ